MKIIQRLEKEAAAFDRTVELGKKEIQTLLDSIEQTKNEITEISEEVRKARKSAIKHREAAEFLKGE